MTVLRGMRGRASELTEKAFGARREADWRELEELVTAAQAGLRALGPERIVRLSPLYRSVCADLAAAQAARYSAPLVDYLRGLTAQAHTLVYGPDLGRIQARGAVRRAWLHAFPRAVRRHGAAMLLSALLFFVPFALGAVLAWREPTFAFRVVPEAMLRPLAEAYAQGFAEGRGAGEGTMMTGFYVYNNVGIALRVFALGIFGGLGSAFYLVQNGLSIGAVLGYVTAEGAGGNIVTFMLGHGGLELGAIVVAGGAGLSLGWSLVAPGDLPRLASLQARARELVVVIGGAAVMLCLAALIEGFWSASSAPNGVKVAVGTTLLVLVLGYVLLAGRGAAEEP